MTWIGRPTHQLAPEETFDLVEILVQDLEKVHRGSCNKGALVILIRFVLKLAFGNVFDDRPLDSSK